MNRVRRFIVHEGHAPGGAIFAGIVCGIALLLVAAIVIGALGRPV